MANSHAAKMTERCDRRECSENIGARLVKLIAADTRPAALRMSRAALFAQSGETHEF
jgi:hypothetical protein